jgi:hypothetical protein
MMVINKIRSSFFDWNRQVPIQPLVVYRILFGALMLFSTTRFLLNGWVYDFYIAPGFHFSFMGFEWVPYPNAALLYFIFVMMILASIGIMMGFFYRFAALLFFVLFTWVELLDKTTYLNHYYFVSLIALIMVFLPANRYFSLDAWLGRVPVRDTVSNRSLAILKFQIAVVYLFAGIAKLESDWLMDAQPLKYWLHTVHHWPLFGDLLKHDGVAYFFSWFGCIYDLFIVFFLINLRTVKWAYGVVIVFHVTTWLLFPIGVFPWVMIAATTIFLPVAFHQQIITGLRRIFRASAPRTTFVVEPPYRFFNILITIYMVFQLTVPFRYLLYPGNLFWTEQGFRFSWRVMLMEKTGYAEFYVTDPGNKSTFQVQNSDHLTRMQEKMMSTQPDMILQYARYLQKTYTDTTLSVGTTEMKFTKPEVHAEIYVTLNGRPSQLYVNKNHNLAAIENDLSHRYWLEDFKE